MGQNKDGLIDEEVFFINQEKRQAETLTLPYDAGPYPAVALISGSGPQNCNGVSGATYDIEYFAIIGEYLIRKGYAVLRYDDRGQGESVENYKEAMENGFEFEPTQPIFIVDNAFFSKMPEIHANGDRFLILQRKQTADQ